MDRRGERVWPVSIAAVIVASAGGCSSGGGGGQQGAGGPGRPVTAEAFVDPTAPGTAAGSTGRSSGSEGGVVPVRGEEDTARAMLRGADAKADPGTAAAGKPAAGASAVAAKPAASAGARPGAAADAAKPSEPPLATTSRVGAPAVQGPAGKEQASVVVESLVGQVNGRAIFASEILGPLDAQLRATARRSDRAAWLKEAAPAINRALNDIVRDELVLAEARTRLTPEQKQGLFNFLNKIQQDVVSRQQGSTVAADEALRSGQGQSLSQASRDELNKALIRHELEERVYTRALVPYRLVRQQYEREYDKYHPKSVARFRLVSVPVTNPDGAEHVRAALAAGTPFDEVADSEFNTFASATSKGRQSIELTGQPEQQFFGVPELNAAAKKLGPGEVAGPIVGGGSTYWVRLESIDSPGATSLYDAQLDIESELQLRRRETEGERYMERLVSRGNVSDRKEMLVRLLQIAEKRYYGPEGQ